MRIIDERVIVLADNMIIAAGAVTAKSIFKSHIIIGGNPINYS